MTKWKRSKETLTNSLTVTRLFRGLFCLVTALLAFSSQSATFSGNARVYSGGNGALTWDPGRNALTVSCWFKLAIPSGTNLTEDMTILVNQNGFAPGSPYAYLIRFGIQSGNVEFVTQGSSTFVAPLIEKPYLERWYHVAIVRSGDGFTGYVDGRQVFANAHNVGNAANDAGLSVGGWGSGRYLFGDVQEVAIAQVFRSQASIKRYMFRDQSELTDLTGYYKLGYSTNVADRLRNFAANVSPAVAEPADKVEFEETSQSGEQSAFDSRRNGGKDALAPLSGAFSWEQTAFGRGVPGIAFDFRIGYSSGNSFGGFKLGSNNPFDAGPLGPGWRHSFETRLLRAEEFDPGGDLDAIGLMMWDGSIETWDLNLTTSRYQTRHKEYRGELEQLDLFLFRWTTPERLQYIFQHPRRGEFVEMHGRLIEIRDPNTNSVRLHWNQINGTLTQIVDTVGGIYNLAYNTQRLLTNVSFQRWSLDLSFDPSRNLLISKTLTNHSGLYSNIPAAWRFQYYGAGESSNLLSSIIDPRGNTNILVHYDKYGRKTNQINAVGFATRSEYNVPGKRQITHTDPATNKWVETYDRKGRVLVQQDPLTNKTVYTYDERGNRTSVTEPLGWKTTFGYDDRANVIAKTNALLQVTRWVIHTNFNKPIQEINALNWTNFYEIEDRTGNMLRHYDDLGTLVSYNYSSNGLVLSSRDGRGYETRFGYNADGFLTSKTDPETNTWIYTVNEIGWKLSELNPLSDLATYSYDINGNVVEMVDPLFRTFRKTYDGSGNLLSVTDGKGQITRNFYDAANQRTQTVDRAGFTNLALYSSRGKLERAIDALGNSITNFYDAANRLERVSNPLGFTITNVFDANGNSIAFFDHVGQRWTKQYDRLNRVIAEIDPLGNTKRTTYDDAGRVQEVRTPNGYPSQNFYDGRGRLVKWKDAEGFEWHYQYDGNSNIEKITDALQGVYEMTYGFRNQRLSELNQDNQKWEYEYDQLLRLAKQTDPNGTERTFEYDQAGRVLAVDFNTGRRNTIRYDDNDNPELLTRREGSRTAALTGLTYDSLDRVTSSRDTFGHQVQYVLDPLGRITNLIYPGSKVLRQSFDAIGRLMEQMDWDNRQTSYMYDQAGRLVWRRYPNGVIQTNSFDSAGRLTSLQYQGNTQVSNSIAIALSYAYDRNGNTVEAKERGTLDWTLAAFTDERARYTPAGKLIDRTIEANGSATGVIQYHYDPSGNMTNAIGMGQSWSLVYDEDNRTTSIRHSGTNGTTVISNRFDSLGRRFVRFKNGEEIRYVLHLAGSMERILCDVNSQNVVTTYIYGPDLSYKIDANGTPVYFHSDAQGNVVALTGSNTTSRAQYAYSPYGRVFGRTNSNNIGNEFLFVGSQGVMEEIPGLYFMRARYYSAEAAVFLSTDPVKKIGPGWKTDPYVYVKSNPMGRIDPDGLFFRTVLSFANSFIRNTIAAISHVSNGGRTTTSTAAQNEREASGSRVSAATPVGGNTPTSGRASQDTSSQALSKATHRITAIVASSTHRHPNASPKPSLTTPTPSPQPSPRSNPQLSARNNSKPTLPSEWKTYDDGTYSYEYRQIKTNEQLTFWEKVKIIIRGPMAVYGKFGPGGDFIEAFAPDDPRYEYKDGSFRFNNFGPSGSDEII